MSTLALADVRWRLRRDPAGGASLVYVSFLRSTDDQQTAAVIGGIRSYLTSLVGHARRVYDPDVPATIAGNRLLGRGLATICQDWYRWTAFGFAEALPPHVGEALGSAGVETPSTLRLRLFDLVNERYAGFVPAGRRSEALTAVARSLGLRPDDAPHLDRALVLDAEEEAVLVSAEPPPTVGDVVARYNRAALAAVLRQAVRISFTLHAPEGGLVRRLYALCRRLGVYCEVEQAGTLAEAFQLTLAGPDAVVGPPAAAGSRLATVALHLLRQIGPLDEASAELVLRGRPCRLRLDRAMLRLPGLTGAATGLDHDDDAPTAAVREEAVGYEAVAPTFDSEVEARLAREFAALRRQGRAAGWRLVREPAPLLAGRRVLLPDFALVRGETRVFVEVAGFWTEGYLAKKRQALEQLPPETPLLLAVAPPAAAALVGLPFPAVPYRNAVPLARLLAAAEAHYGDFAGRTAGATERLAAACAADTSGRLPDAHLAALLGCHSPGEVARTLAATPLPADWTHLPGAGLIGPHLRAALDSTLTEAWEAGGPDTRLALADLRARMPDAALPESDEALTALLEQLPSCRVVRGSLFTVELCPPGSERSEADGISADDRSAPAGKVPASVNNPAAGSAGPSPARRRRAAPRTAGMKSLF